MMPGRDAHGSEAMTRDEIVAMFARREEAFARKDSVALSADYTADAVIYSPSSGVHQGRAAAERAFEMIFKAFADITRRTEALVVDGAQVAEVLAFEGTNLGGLMGLPPNGRRFSVPAVFLYELSGTQIVRERRIYDFTGVLIQVGVMKARPA
jgi:predicted ester cyclase